MIDRHAHPGKFDGKAFKPETPDGNDYYIIEIDRGGELIG